MPGLATPELTMNTGPASSRARWIVGCGFAVAAAFAGVHPQATSRQDARATAKVSNPDVTTGFAVARAARPQGSGGQGGGATILERAPTDRSIAISSSKLVQYFGDMDARQLSTLRMIEGGKYNVNIRRITNAETALVHPATIDVWVVLEGRGTMTTGGRLVDGKIVGGVTNPLKAGDVEFIPTGVPHGVSEVNGHITWLNVRWDTDWPSDAALGAGNPPPPPGGVRPGPGTPGSVVPLEYAPADHAIHIPRETLDAYRMDMNAKGLAVLRLIEGGHFNVNIRRIKGPSTEFHDTTVDTWVLLEGSGTVSTGFSTDRGDQRAGAGTRKDGTGVDVPAAEGDLVFIPARFTHGFSAVHGAVAWLNIRWDTNYAAK